MALAVDRAAYTASDTSVRLLGGFGVIEGGRPVMLPTDAQRVVVFLAIHPDSIPRSYVAGSLWFDSSEERAYGNLRSALWRLRQRTSNLVDSDSHTLRLNAATDISAAISLANKHSSPTDCTETDHDIEPFMHDLLPGWYDEFVLVERERLRQVSLHALEAIAYCRIAQRRFAAAIAAAIAAIRLDPLRESAHRAAISVHLAEGNHSEAIRQYGIYADVLDSQLGLSPSPQIRRLFEGDLATAIGRL